MAEKESKKRKRQSSGVADKPNKKAASENTNSSERIKVRLNEDEGLHPVLVSSPGLTAPSITFKAYTKPTSTRIPSDGPIKPSSHEIILQSSEHPRLDYLASPITLDQNLLHFIAVYDAETNELQITPAHHVSLRSALRSEAKNDDKKRRTVGQQREELGREFGTKKAKKAIADKTVNAIVKDTKGKSAKDAAQDAVLDTMAAATAQKKTELEELEASLASKPIPKPNLAADSFDDVYRFNNLIPSEDARLLAVKEWQEKARAEEDVPTPYRCISRRVANIGKSDNIERLKALRYLYLLLSFHAALQGGGRATKKVPKKEVLDSKLGTEWPEALISSVRKRFANANNELPKWHVDNLYTHMCALSLFVEGWSTNITGLKEDLGLETKVMVQYFKELGCKVERPTVKESEGMNKAQKAAARVAKLKLPLEFPKARAARRA